MGLKFVQGDFAVKAFFVISGFLITSSFLANQDLNTYFKKRFLRIYPPIVITVIIVTISTILFSDSSVNYLISITQMLFFKICSQQH